MKRKRTHLSVIIDDSALAYLKSCARIRDLAFCTFLTKLTTAISEGQLVAAILDDTDNYRPSKGRYEHKWHANGKDTR